MRNIKFSHNWNGKLDLNIFTTIRAWTEDKEAYYKESIGAEFEILLKDKVKCKAELQDAEVMEFSDIPDGLIMYDTGLPLSEANEVFGQFGLIALPNHKAIILTFERSANLKEKTK